MRNSTTDFSAGQATDITSHDGHQALVPAQAANRFERPESYTAVLQRQNVALQIEVAKLHLQIRDLQLALVVEKALGVVNMRMHHLPSSGSAKAVADLRKKP